MKVVTLGEVMLRLTPPGYSRLLQAETFEAEYGGAEANVAVALAMWGENACFVSKIPENDIGQAAVNKLRRYGVDTGNVVRGGDRLGIYYAERGADRRASEILYDRAHSSFACSEAEEYDWDRIFEGADWFHFTGITPALGRRAERITQTACEQARKKGVRISCDVNYRSKLWSEDAARSVMETFLRQIDLCITNEYQAKELFGAPREEVAEYMRSKYSLGMIAFTYRKTFDATHNMISGAIYDGEHFYRSCEYLIEMVDRIGGGDAFAAGVLYGIGNGYALQQTVDFAAAAGCLKHSVKGDCCLIGKEQILRLANGGDPAQVRR